MPPLPRHLDGVRGLLLDVDGTLLVDDQAVPGAPRALERLRAAGLPFCITTNITRLSRSSIAARLVAAGMSVPEELVLNPSVLARRRILDSPSRRAHLLVPDETRIDFSGVEETAEDPSWVVLGDLGAGFTRRRLDPAFRSLERGARLLALHRGRSWRDPEEGWVLDAGAFVAALEYAAGVTAEVVGKPSPDFFHLALRDLGVPAGEVLVVGDDLAADIGGGASAGCRTALVGAGRSGKARGPLPVPDLRFGTIAELL